MMKRGIFFAVIALLLTVSPSWAFWGKYATLPLRDGVAGVPAADLEDGKAHFYQTELDGKKIGFFLVKDAQGTIRSAFDACDVCFHAKKGYTEGTNGLMVCGQCGMRFPIGRIGDEKGGCNPAPMTVAVQDGRVVIRAEDLGAGARFF